MEVSILSSTFAKESQYFVALQLNQGEKVRTEVCDASAKPVFTKSTFTFHLSSQLTADAAAAFPAEQKLTLGAFVVISQVCLFFFLSFHSFNFPCGAEFFAMFYNTSCFVHVHDDDQTKCKGG